MIARRVGLAALMICTLLPIALSATGSRLVVVTGAVFVCLPLLLAPPLRGPDGDRGGRFPVAGTAGKKNRGRCTCLLAVALIPVTWWPLRLAFAMSNARVV